MGSQSRALRDGQPGFLSRPAEWWSHRFFIPERQRQGYGDYFFALYEGDGPEGYVLYRTKHDWPDGLPGYAELHCLTSYSFLPSTLYLPSFPYLGLPYDGYDNPAN